jgi:hypothetical protein
MAEAVTQEQVVTPQAQATDPKVPITAEPQVVEDKSKAEIAGLNKKISTLEKQISDAKKAQMTEAERDKTEKAELEKLRAETLKEKLTYRLGRNLIKKGLPEELTDLLLTPPQTEEELDEYTGKIEGFFKAHSAKAVEELRKGNTRTTPITTGSAKVMARAEFNKLSPTERSKFMLDGGTLKD